ncbi:MAG: UDP-2,4-diacetamido-2,4,6-trideoxy-beta-L-altropyranose hydrolase [Proteobacteria bacterium]|nr:UDP-2,4-diacetamido-2,4,6-trideoxy-beta-L-altropyranose hydrolase [Pseudomonadota bacterium]
MKTALFLFEASSKIGAGHAIRSCVLAEALKEHHWMCKIITLPTTYEFISQLKSFERVDPRSFYYHPFHCDLLVIDNYNIEKSYEAHFRPFAKKIMVIDDLANRQHECDILLDQTYGQLIETYKNLVPQRCKILTGIKYALLRTEFRELRPKALKKRKQTTQINRILISMGGSDPQNYTLKALDIIKRSQFRGNVDIVLGFEGQNLSSVEEYIKNIPNECFIHINADMPKLTYQADLAIGASGSSMWERCTLGLPTLMFTVSSNQELIAKNLHKSGAAFLVEDLKNTKTASDFINNLMMDKEFLRTFQKNASETCDGMGINSVLEVIHDIH